MQAEAYPADLQQQQLLRPRPPEDHEEVEDSRTVPQVDLPVRVHNLVEEHQADRYTCLQKGKVYDMIGDLGVEVHPDVVGDREGMSSFL